MNRHVYFDLFFISWFEPNVPSNNPCEHLSLIVASGIILSFRKTGWSCGSLRLTYRQFYPHLPRFPALSCRGLKTESNSFYEMQIIRGKLIKKFPSTQGAEALSHC